MINMSASKPMFLDSFLFSSIFLGLVFPLVFSGTIYLRHLPWHYNDLLKQYRVPLGLHILRKDNLNIVEDKTQLT